MKVRVRARIQRVYLDNAIQKDAILEVEHFAYGKFYKITSPKEVCGITIDKDSIEFLPEVST